MSDSENYAKKLINAAQANNISSMKKIFQKMERDKSKSKSKISFNVNATDCNGRTTLHYAARNGNVEMIDFLLSKGAYLDITDKNGRRPISHACAANNLNAVKFLLDSGTSPNSLSVDEDNSPLHIASASGYGEIVTLLLEKGIHLQSTNKQNQTPIDVACENGHYGIVNLLLSASSRLMENSSNGEFQKGFMKSDPTLYYQFKEPNQQSIIGKSNIPDKNYATWCSAAKPLFIQNPINFFTYKKSGNLSPFSDKDEACYMRTKITPLTSDVSKPDMKNEESEITLPYPSKFGTKEILKIKSPLFPIRNSLTPDGTMNGRFSVTLDKTSPNETNPTKTDKKKVKKKENIFTFDHRSHEDENFLNSKCKTHSPQFAKVRPFHYPISSFKPHYFNTSYTVDSAVCNIKSPSLFPSPFFSREFGSETDINRNPMSRSLNEYSSELRSPNKDKIPMRSISVQEKYTKKTQFHTNQKEMRKTSEYCDCKDWIFDIGLERIYNTLIKEGFDSFLALSIASEDELLELCDNNIIESSLLKNKIDSLGIPPIETLQFSTNILELLTQIGLECYHEDFLNNGFKYTYQAFGFAEKDLNRLQIYKMGHRKLLLSCFNLSTNNFNEEKIVPSTNNVKIRFESNSVPQLRHSSYQTGRKMPPPIPPRSCSITEESIPTELTLDQVLQRTSKSEAIRDAKINAERNSQSLDDIVKMLSDLGRMLNEDTDKSTTK